MTTNWKKNVNIKVSHHNAWENDLILYWLSIAALKSSINLKGMQQQRFISQIL